MKPASIVNLVTQDSLQLNAIMFGSPHAEIGLLFIHGLSSSAFSHNDILPANAKHASLYMHNRGHDGLTGIKRLMPETDKGYEWFPGGMAHEVFTDCVQDIQAGVDYLKGLGIKEVYLVGHSTGCQKSIYYLAQSHNQKDIAGAILICPMSDYAAAKHTEDPEKLSTATQCAQKMVSEGVAGELLPPAIWPQPIDAQRFLSLYTPDSLEEIFCYSQSGRKPKLLQQAGVPLFILLAEKDEYADRPVSDLAKWFEENADHSSVRVIPDSLHSLTGKSDEIKALIEDWLLALLV